MCQPKSTKAILDKSDQERSHQDHVPSTVHPEPRFYLLRIKSLLSSPVLMEINVVQKVNIPPDRECETKTNISGRLHLREGVLLPLDPGESVRSPHAHVSQARLF